MGRWPPSDTSSPSAPHQRCTSRALKSCSLGSRNCTTMASLRRCLGSCTSLWMGAGRVSDTSTRHVSPLRSIWICSRMRFVVRRLGHWIVLTLKNGAKVIICFMHTARAELVYLNSLVGSLGAAVLVKLMNVIRYAEPTTPGRAAARAASLALKSTFSWSQKHSDKIWAGISGVSKRTCVCHSQGSSGFDHICCRAPVRERVHTGV